MIKIAILMLTHNAPRYVIKTLRTLRGTCEIEYELICVDNNSSWKTQLVVMVAFWFGIIDKLCFSKKNTLFAGGNNIAAHLVSDDVTHFLLLNSDIEIFRKDWLLTLVRNHKRGLTSFGVVEGRPIDRLDGYCLLIDRDIYEKYQLDENFQWWWSVTKLQSQALGAGYSVHGFKEHEAYLHHFGGKSGASFKGARGMGVNPEEVVGWFGNHRVLISEKPDD